jgi:hypothetical protein
MKVRVLKEIVKKYSVYELWVMGEDSPFYVGKGVKDRPYSHLRLARKKDMSFKSKKIRKAWSMNLPIIIKRVFRTDINEEAIEEEIRLIALYGRKDNGTGSLTNHTSGGDGIINLSEEARKRKSEKLKGNKYQEPHRSEETKKKIGKFFAGRPLSEEHRQKLSIKLKGNKNGLGNKSRLGRSNSKEHIQKTSDSNRGQKRSEEIRRRMSIAQKKVNRGGPLSEEHRRKIGDAQRGRKKPPMSEETRKKLSNITKKYYARQEQTRKNLITIYKILGINEGD